MKINVYLAQIDIKFGKPQDNFSQIESFVKKAAASNADIVVFPEMWNTGYDLTRFSDIADTNGNKTKELLSKLASEYRIAIHGGSVAVNEKGKFYNQSFIYSKEGQLLDSYKKVHLFGLMNEDKFLQAGDKKVYYQINGVPATGVICYDIRFPEWLRTLSLSGSKIIFVPAEWPTPRIMQWRRLLSARAIENQCFVVGVNRVGSDPDNQFGGHSGVYDPLGNEIISLNDQPQGKLVTLDLDQVDKVRGSMPVFADRRPELYN